MAGIIAVYGLVVSVLIVGSLNPSDPYPLYAGFIHLAAGLSCGLTGLAAGRAIGVVGDACARAYLRQGRVFVAMVLMLVSAGEAGRPPVFITECSERLTGPLLYTPRRFSPRSLDCTAVSLPSSALLPHRASLTDPDVRLAVIVALILQSKASEGSC